LTLHEPTMTTQKSRRIWAPLAEHALPVQIPGIVVVENLATSLHLPTIYPPFTHHWPTIHPRPMETPVVFGCLNQGTFHYRCKLHRELVGLIWEECLLHRSCGTHPFWFFWGGAHVLYPKWMVYDGKFY
jgi:hypothetical protein